MHEKWRQIDFAPKLENDRFSDKYNIKVTEVRMISKLKNIKNYYYRSEIQTNYDIRVAEVRKTPKLEKTLYLLFKNGDKSIFEPKLDHDRTSDKL